MLGNSDGSSRGDNDLKVGGSDKFWSLAKRFEILHQRRTRTVSPIIELDVKHFNKTALTKTVVEYAGTDNFFAPFGDKAIV